MFCRDDKEAQRKEREFIALYGRADLGRGTLVNFTDGGDGHSGIITSPELIRKRSLAARGKRPDKWVEAIRKSRAGGGNGGVVKLGDKLPNDWRENISKAVTGSLNHNFGNRGGGLSKRVVNSETGQEYASVTEAANDNGLKMKSLYNKLSGFRTNNTPLKFL